MPDSIVVLHRLLREAHIVVGFLGLAAFWVVVVLPKGTRRHVAAGRVFAWSGLFVSLSGLFASTWAVVSLTTFLASLRQRSDPAELPADERAFIHLFFSILLYLSTAALSAAVLGIRLARTQKRHDQLPSLAVRAVTVLGPFAGALLCTYGLVNTALVLMGRHALSGGAAGLYGLCIALGGLGVVSGLQDWKYVFGPPPALKMGWLYKHIECMVGLAIAFHTAFLVFGARRFIPGANGPLQLVFWIAPSVIGVTAANRWVKAYQKKFNDLPAAESVAPSRESSQPSPESSTPS